MAENLQLLKRRIKTAGNIAQIAKAMEMISASKIKKAQAAVINNKPYAQRITTLTSNILKNLDSSKFNHPYITKPTSENKLLLVISPDKGLCGSLNTNLFKKLLQIDNKNIKMIAVGKKAARFCRNMSGELIAEFNIGTTLPPYSIVYRLMEIVNKEYDLPYPPSFQILFSEFKSIFTQEPVLRDVLPIATESDEDVTLPYVFEPAAAILLESLLPYFLEVTLYNSLLEAFTSEQAARMMAMQNAKNNALDISDFLTLSYNKSRQERITNELLTLSNNL